MDPRVDDVIDFWFGDEPVPSPQTMARWFTADPALDTEVQRRFGFLLDDVAALDAWRGTPRGELAMIVVLDQFSRNSFRDGPRAYEHDPLALSIARGLLRSGAARSLTWSQRMIALMPFQHAEDLATQQEGIAAFAALVDDARAAGVERLEMLESALDYQRRHAAVIARFGRFPHRNDVLGRPSTPEETAFLAHGVRF